MTATHVANVLCNMEVLQIINMIQYGSIVQIEDAIIGYMLTVLVWSYPKGKEIILTN